MTPARATEDPKADSRKERFLKFHERHGRALFTPDFNTSLTAAMHDEENTIADRVFAWAKLHAWGNYSDFAVDGDLRPVGQTDCAAELQLTKQLVNNAVRYWESRGYIRTEGRLIYPVDAPEPAKQPANVGERFPSFRSFLETWAAKHPGEYQEFEETKKRLKSLQTRILEDYRSAKKSPNGRTLPPESHSTAGLEVTPRQDLKSPDGRTNSRAYKEEGLEGLEELSSSSSSSVPRAPEAPTTTTPQDARQRVSKKEAFRAELTRIFVDAGKDNPTPKQIREVGAALPDHPEAPGRFLQTLESKIARVQHPGALASIVEGFNARWPAILEIIECLNHRSNASTSASAGEEIAAFLGRCAQVLDQREGFESIAHDLRTMARNDSDPELVEGRLTELGARMDAIARTRVNMENLLADVDRDPQLTQHKARMTKQQYSTLRDQFIERWLRDALQLPALSLFYLR
jgi:hypothetical protein